MNSCRLINNKKGCLQTNRNNKSHCLSNLLDGEPDGLGQFIEFITQENNKF
jgi:hypothetical protein